MVNKKIYAYDFFDTVAHRNCHSEKVLFEWSKQISHFLNFLISPSDLYQLRKQIENNLKISDDIEEPTYDELIKKIYEKIKDVSINQTEFIDYCYKCELEIEQSHLFLDENCVQEIRNHKVVGDHIILISDFYLGKNFIEALLKGLNFEGYFSEIFVSSDLNRRKSTGNLYKYVLEYLKISPDNLFMHGDNYESDVLIPRKLKIHSSYRKYKNSYHVLNAKELKQKTKKLLFSDIKKNALGGYAGELVFFTSKLYEKLCRAEIKKVLFCSREGQFLKKLFDIYQLEVWGKIKIESHYFYVSRKAVMLPSLDKFDVEEFKMIFRQFEKLKVKDFLSSIGFYEKEIIQVCNESQISVESEISINKDNEAYNCLLLNKRFIDLYDEKRITQKSLFYRYLMELGYSLKNDNITIVDIGWKGTIQDCIQRCLPDDCTVEGYYLGLRTSEFGCINSNLKHGLLFSDNPKKCKNYNIFEHGYMFYERIFVADHGPILGYYLKDNKVIPNIDNSPEELGLYNYIKPYQNKLLITFEKLLKLFSESQWEAYEQYELMLNNFLWKQCIYFPQIWEIEKIARDKARENFGDISKNETHKKKHLGFEQLKKADFLFVDYSFRLLESCHLNCLLPIAEIYCRLVYLIKRITLE